MSRKKHQETPSSLQTRPLQLSGAVKKLGVVLVSNGRQHQQLPAQRKGQRYDAICTTNLYYLVLMYIWWKFKRKTGFVSHLYASEESLVDRKILKAHICEDPPETTKMAFACQECANAAQFTTPGCMKASKSGSPLANSPPSKRNTRLGKRNQFQGFPA